MEFSNKALKHQLTFARIPKVREYPEPATSLQLNPADGFQKDGPVSERAEAGHAKARKSSYASG